MAVTPLSHLPGIQPFSHDKWPLELRAEVAALEASDPVVTGSVQVYAIQASHSAERGIVLVCLVRRHQPAQTIDPRIQLQEPIALLYSSATINLTAPTIYSERSDFPRDLPHLNPVGTSSPVSICVAREGVQALYDIGGIKIVIGELAKWLTDAAAGRLEHDGWESTPITSYSQASLDGEWIQNQAHTKSATGPTTLLGIADVVFVERNGQTIRTYIDIHAPDLAVSAVISLPLKQKTLEDGEKRLELPWFFACGVRDSPVSLRDYAEVQDETGLLRKAELAGCKEQLQQYLHNILPRRRHVPVGTCVILGTWRPDQLIPDIPGLATGEPRRLELSAYFVWLDNYNGKPHTKSVHQLRVVARPTSALLAKMAGFKTPLRPCAIVGCGALGSKIGSFLVRDGIGYLALVDPDVFAPHNLARHELKQPSVGLYKAKELKREYERVLGGDQGGMNFSSRAKTFNIHLLDRRGLDEALHNKTELIIDATADRRALIRLCRGDQKRPVIRAELADQGRLGLLYVEGRDRSPRIDDLEASVYLHAQSDSALVEWLKRERRLPEISTGLGCASPTMVMPDSQVALHAASFMPAITERLNGVTTHGGIGINYVTSEGYPSGWKWLTVPPFTVLPLDTATGREDKWELRIHPEALSRAVEKLQKQDARESGGYLYGRYELALRTLTVVEAFAVPPLDSSATTLLLPPAGNTPAEKMLCESSSGVLTVVGSWHTHLNGNSDLSDTDRRQAETFARNNRTTPRPMVMLILSSAGVRGYVVYPENW